MMNKNALSSCASATLDDQTLLAVSGGRGRLPRTHIDVDVNASVNYDCKTNTTDLNLDINVDVVTVQGRGNRVSSGDNWVVR